jgi:hypothetical protein
MVEMCPACRNQHISLILKASDESYIKGYRLLQKKMNITLNMMWEDEDKVSRVIFVSFSKFLLFLSHSLAHSVLRPSVDIQGIGFGCGGPVTASHNDPSRRSSVREVY